MGREEGQGEELRLNREGASIMAKILVGDSRRGLSCWRWRGECFKGDEPRTQEQVCAYR